MARRLQISRQRAVGQRPALLLGLNARLAVCVVVLFTVASLVAYRLTNLGSEHARARWSVASAWADRLMYGAELTPYGWVPEERAARAVDEDLSSVQAAFVLLDAADRVVRASECLLMRTASVVRTGVGDRINIPPLGEVVVTRLPVRVFGERQGTFLLLSKGSGAAVPVPKPWSRSYEPPAEQVIAVAPDWSFILVGVLLMGLGAYLAVYVFATARLNRMTSVALGSNPGAQAPRRFSATGGDEIGNLADALNAMQRRTLRRVATMTERESNRRDWLSELSHDLRTPLSALQLRLDNARGAQPDRLAETVATAADDCQRIQTLAKGFMDLAGLEVTEDFAFEPVKRLASGSPLD
jgi:signal transduction histidine kinase